MEGKTGLYGKMPAAGDFVRLGLPRDFVEPWDAWLQSAMREGQARLGTGWDAAYLSAPIWRFALPAGLAGPAPMLGVVMPSVDRVGRRFPLTLAMPHPAPVRAMLAGEGRMAAMETLALDILDEAVARDAMPGALAALPGGPAAPAEGDAFAAPAASVLAARHMDARPGASLWTAEVEGGARTLVCAGLPAGAQAAALWDAGAAIWGAAPARAAE